MVVFFALRGYLAKFYNEGMLPSFHPTHWPYFGIGFGWENEGLWTHVLHRSCSCIYELDVRLLNHSNWTSTTHIMFHFLGLPQLRLLLSLCPDFGTGFR